MNNTDWGVTDAERSELLEVVKRLKGSSQKVRRANMLLMADADGPRWTDAKIAKAYQCWVQTVERLRERFVIDGFAVTLHGQPRQKPPRAKLLHGEQEAKIIATRLGSPDRTSITHYPIGAIPPKCVAEKL